MKIVVDLFYTNVTRFCAGYKMPNFALERKTKVRIISIRNRIPKT
jgi:hypothetical protein